MPEHGHTSYSINVEFEIPANIFARHLPWDQLQSWTRLDGSVQAPRAGEALSIDALRRGAIGLAHKLARAGEGFSRHCRLAGSMSVVPLTPASLEDGLALWLSFARHTAWAAREGLAADVPFESVEIALERRLVDEYVSVRLLEMLASAERALAALRESRNWGMPTREVAIERVEASLAQALESEVAYRDARGWLHPDARSLATLEQYIERASRLKKHFQEVLFLEPETFQVAERLHNWVAAFVALVASTWAFLWQVALLEHKPTVTSRVGSGIFVLAVVAGLVYAVKDRIKELGRAWISGNVHRFYAQRVARWRAPARRLSGRNIVVRARESFDTRVVLRPDALNPESGASTPATLIRYMQRGTVHAIAPLATSGVRRVKHVFRYDLSPLFARLDDPVKQVPVLDTLTRRVTFTAAPRCYRVPVRLHVCCGGLVRDERATLVLHKRGLERLEFEEGGETALETGVLPT